MRTGLWASVLGLALLAAGPAAAEGEINTGEALANQYCAACHGPTGEGLGPNPAIAGMPEAQFIEIMQQFRSGERKSGTMGTLSAGLSDAQFQHLAAFYASLDAVESTGFRVDGPLHHVSAEVCASCHQEIYNEWKGSMHGNSTALRDPIHELLYRKVVGDPRRADQLHTSSGKFPVCLNCHAPNAARDRVTKLDARDAYAEGVNCVSCHQISGYKGVEREGGGLRLGILAYETRDRLQGPRGFRFDQVAQGNGADTNPHIAHRDASGKRVEPALPMDGNPALMKRSELCLGCHHQRPNPQGVPLCDTGNEIEASGSQVTCQTCHMPSTGTHASHRMGGGHDTHMLSRAVRMEVKARSNGDRVRADVEITNLLPHRMPTGAPFRNVQVRVTALDADGTVVWQNYSDDPENEAPEAFMFYQLADDEGKPDMPPTATGVRQDTRLDPHERRVITYDDIPAEAAHVRAEMLYNLVFERMKPGVMKLTDDAELLQPRSMAFHEARVQP